jgi:hypothetical protein
MRRSAVRPIGRFILTALAIVSASSLLTACIPNNSPSKFGVNICCRMSGPVEDAMRDAGFKWTRMFMFWPDLEVGRNQYDWTQIAKYDAQVNALVAHHFSVIVVWEGIPRRAMTTPLKDYKCSKDSTMGPPASPVYFQEFAATIAQRYGDRVAAYELWNEPDGNCKWPGKGSQFRDLIAVPGFDGIRSQQPNAVVLTPGIGDVGVAPSDLPTIWDNFLTYTHNSHTYLARPFSALALHAYGSRTRVQDKIGKAASYSRCMEYTPTQCMTSFWITEFGFNEPRAPGTGCWTWYGCDNNPGADAQAVFKTCHYLADCTHALYWGSDKDDYSSTGQQLSSLALLDPTTLAPRQKYWDLRALMASHWSW